MICILFTCTATAEKWTVISIELMKKAINHISTSESMHNFHSRYLHSYLLRVCRHLVCAKNIASKAYVHRTRAQHLHKIHTGYWLHFISVHRTNSRIMLAFIICIYSQRWNVFFFSFVHAIICYLYFRHHNIWFCN